MPLRTGQQGSIIDKPLSTSLGDMSKWAQLIVSVPGLEKLANP